MTTFPSHIIRGPTSQDFEINEEQFIELIDFMNGSTFKAKRHRIAEYFHADKTKEIALVAITSGVGVIAISATTGGAIGLCIGGPKAGVIGIGVGALAGVVMVAITSCVILRKEYNNWKKNISNEKIVHCFEMVHKENPELKEFIDPIFKNILIDPYLTICGHTFEKSVIFAHIERNINNATCPICRHKITKDTTQVDIITVGKMKRIYAKFAKEKMESLEYSKQITEAFKALHTDLENQAKEVMKDVSTKLAILLAQEKITVEAYMRKSRQLFELFPEYHENNNNTNPAIPNLEQSK